MAITEASAKNFVTGKMPEQRAMVSICSSWFPLISAGGVATADNSGSAIVNPVSSITAASRIRYDVYTFPNDTTYGFCTTLLLRLAYDKTLTSITSPVVQVFGFDNTTTTPYTCMLPNQSGSYQITLTCVAASDETDGTLCYTKFDPTAHAIDLLGNGRVLVGVMTALVGSTGSTATAVVQGKLI